MDFLKKNRLIAGVVVVIVLVLLGVGFFLAKTKGSQSALTPGDQTQNIKKLSPDDIGLKLTFRPDNRAIEMEISKLSGIKSIEYEVSYNAKPPPDVSVEDGQAQDIPRGVVASPIEVKPEDSTIKKEILLGTCSSGTCKYDTVTSGVKFVIKVNYSNGEVGSVEDCLKNGSLDCVADSSTGQ